MGITDRPESDAVEIDHPDLSGHIFFLLLFLNAIGNAALLLDVVIVDLQGLLDLLA